ncbi:hypothetical protein ACUUL3_02210 [Thiovibrio sp. JS02]
MACPYFRRENHECNLTANGIFVPSANHIVVFCSSRFFPECKHFLKGSPLYERAQAGSQNSVSGHAGRRRFARFDGKYALAIRKANGAAVASLNDGFDASVVAVNYGQGGIRVQSNKKLPEDSPLFIHFAKDFIVPELRGMAHVCWQTQERKNEQWVAGLAFEDACVGALIALQVDL